MIDKQALYAQRGNPLVWGTVACWSLEAAMNARYGYRTAGPFVAGVFLAIAVFAALLPGVAKDISPTGIVDYLRKGAICILWLFCFGLCQWTGWATLGTLLADGRAVREDAATGRAVAQDTLKAKREALAKLAQVRAPAQVQAAIDAALDKPLKNGRTIRDASAGCADAGVAPTTCKQVADLRRELADAKQKDALEAEVNGAAGRLDKAPKVAEGTSEAVYLSRLSGYEAADIAFWFGPTLAVLTGLLANFGLMLAGVGSKPQPARQGAHPPSPDDWFRGLPLQYRPVGPALPPPSAYASGPSQHPFHGRHYDDAARYHAQPGASAFHGAPINITVSGPSGAASGPHPGVAAPTPAADSGSPTVAPPVPLLSPPSQFAPQGVAPLGSLTPAILPVDRAPVKAAVDKLLTFRAACLVDAPGEGVLVDDLFGRYETWAQGRGMVSHDLFAALFPEATGLPVAMLGGRPHVTGVQLRSLPQLQLVG